MSEGAKHSRPWESHEREQTGVLSGEGWFFAGRHFLKDRRVRDFGKSKLKMFLNCHCSLEEETLGVIRSQRPLD